MALFVAGDRTPQKSAREPGILADSLQIVFILGIQFRCLGQIGEDPISFPPGTIGMGTSPVRGAR